MVSKGTQQVNCLLTLNQNAKTSLLAVQRYGKLSNENLKSYFRLNVNTLTVSLHQHSVCNPFNIKNNRKSFLSPYSLSWGVFNSISKLTHHCTMYVKTCMKLNSIITLLQQLLYPKPTFQMLPVSFSSCSSETLSFLYSLQILWSYLSCKFIECTWVSSTDSRMLAKHSTALIQCLQYSPLKIQVL